MIKISIDPLLLDKHEQAYSKAITDALERLSKGEELKWESKRDEQSAEKPCADKENSSKTSTWGSGKQRSTTSEIWNRNKSAMLTDLYGKIFEWHKECSLLKADASIIIKRVQEFDYYISKKSKHLVDIREKLFERQCLISFRMNIFGKTLIH